MRIAADGGRVAWTADGGFTWTDADVSDDVETQVQLKGLFLMPDGADVLGWAVGDGGVVLRTVPDTDGQVWADANPDDRVTNMVGDGDPCEPVGQLAELFAIYMTSELDGFVVGNDGVVQKTEDGGETWSPLASPGVFGCSNDPLDTYDIHFFADSGDSPIPAYSKGVLTSEYGKIFVTEDSGETWTEVDVREEVGVDLCPLSEHNLEFWAIDFDDRADADSGWWLAGGVGTSQGYLFRKEPGWESGSWSQTYCIDFFENTQQLINLGTCTLATQYAVARLGLSDPVAMIAGYAGSLYIRETGTANFDPCICDDVQSEDCSSNSPTWVQRDTSFEESDLCSDRTPYFACDRITATSGVAVGQFGRITRWDHTPPGGDVVLDLATQSATRLLGGAFISDTTGCVIGQGYSIWRTTDGGVDWDNWHNVSNWDCEGGEYGNALAFSASGQYGSAVGTNGFVASSTNYGASWTRFTWSITTDFNAVTYVPGTSTVFAAGMGGEMKKSTNDGQWWRGATSAGSADLYGISFADEDVGYVCGADRAIYRTVDGGGSWAAVTVTGSGTETLRAIKTWGNGSQAVAVGDGGHIYEKTGSTFDPVDPGLTPEVRQHLYDVEVFVNGSDVDLRICGASGAVLFRDAGTWTQVRSYSSFPLYKLAFQNADEGFAIGQSFGLLRYE